MTRPAIVRVFGLVGSLWGGAVASSAAQARSADAAYQSRPQVGAADSTAVGATTTGTVALSNGTSLGFRAELGTLPVFGKDSGNAPIGGLVEPRQGRPVARMSYIAYFADTPDQHDRPVLFLWDGGPGASTRSLVVDSFGPVRVAVPGPEQAMSLQAPTIRNNPDCLLDVADLVFIDAPGTGFGRIEGQGGAEAFYGIDGDAAAFAHFIEDFLITHGRERTPFFILGHSYGTMRSPVVARDLAGDDFVARGIVAIAQWLNNDDNVFSVSADPGTDNAYVDALPSYAATTWYHHRLPGPTMTLQQVIEKAQAFALGDYASALLAGSALSASRRHAVASELEDLTGIPATTWIGSDLRIDGSHFQRLILGDPDRTVARLDARYTGYVGDPLSSIADIDPFGGSVGPTLAVAGETYERDVLGAGRRAAFSPDADVPGLDWNISHSTDGKPWDSFYNVIPDLASVMLGHPETRYLTIDGYYDLGTTYLGAIQDLRHLPIPESIRSNTSAVFFPTGHEPYIQDDVRHSMHGIIARFIEQAD